MANRSAFFALAAAALLLGCSQFESDNPYDPDNWKSSSSRSMIVQSSSSAPPSSSSSADSLTSSSSVAPSSSSINAGGGGKGTLTDSRDGKEYNTVEIGTQVWMAENLNYAHSDSRCYNNSESNCATYGRLYNWSTAMGGSASSTANPSGVRGICPEGWHLPSQAEWNALAATIQSEQSCSSCDAKHLKATSGWGSTASYNGTNTYGFAALPGGYGYPGGDFLNAGYNGYWWSASEFGSNYAYSRYMYYGEDAHWNDYSKTYLFSVRCLQD